MKFLELEEKMRGMKLFSPRQMRILLGSHVPKTLSLWTKKEHIEKLRNNLYFKISEKENIEERDLFFLANHMYAPSYVSLETAFSFYSLIPEGVYMICSCTTQKTNTFDTSLGLFKYRKLKKELFFGYNIIRTDQSYFRIADLEKSILDYLYLNPIEPHPEAFESLRWNQEVLKTLHPKRLSTYLDLFGSHELNKRISALKKYYG